MFINNTDTLAIAITLAVAITKLQSKAIKDIIWL